MRYFEMPEKPAIAGVARILYGGDRNLPARIGAEIHLPENPDVVEFFPLKNGDRNGPRGKETSGRILFLIHGGNESKLIGKMATMLPCNRARKD